MTIRLLFTLLALAALSGAALAHMGNCCSCGGPELGTVPVGAGPAQFYLVDRGVVTGDGLWLYEESNTVPGLQTGGCSAVVPNDCEICWDDSTWQGHGPDALIE